MPAPKRLQANSERILELLEQMGLRPTKANFVMLYTDGTNPDFPLDAEIVAEIPEELPGKIPTDPMALYADVEPPASARPDKEDDEEDA